MRDDGRKRDVVSRLITIENRLRRKLRAAGVPEEELDDARRQDDDEGTCHKCGADEVELFDGLCFECYEGDRDDQD